jgi:serine/threonine-protein phosphatase 5
MEPPENGLMSDLLWSDPQPFPGKAPSKRGVGFSFGPDITASFLTLNNLDVLVRSHEVKEEGYLVEHDGKTITVFSAPNYCDTMGNKGAYIHFDETYEPKFTKFEAVSHPNVKPMAYAAGMGGLFA